MRFLFFPIASFICRIELQKTIYCEIFIRHKSLETGNFFLLVIYTDATDFFSRKVLKKKILVLNRAYF